MKKFYLDNDIIVKLLKYLAALDRCKIHIQAKRDTDSGIKVFFSLNRQKVTPKLTVIFFFFLMVTFNYFTRDALMQQYEYWVSARILG